MSKTLKIHFYLKKPKLPTVETFPIYLRLTIGGQRTELSTKRECEPVKWNKFSGRVIGNKEDVSLINNHLNCLQNDLFIAEKELSMKWN